MNEEPMMSGAQQPQPDMEEQTHFEAIVIGSGFGGAVTFRRLVEAGFNTCILERGRRYEPDNDFPVHPFPKKGLNVPYALDGHARTPVQPDVSRLTWARDRGLWDMRDIGDVVVGQAAGWGGGSLVYANVHLRPAEHVFDERWPIERKDLDEYYDLVAKELRVSPIPDEYRDLPKCVQLERFADGIPGPDGPRPSYLRRFSPPLAVDFAQCDLQGNCLFGCPKKGAKNTLDTNYLRKAEERGKGLTTVITSAEVAWIAQRAGKEGNGFEVEYRDVSPGPTRSRTITADYVFVCAGAVNTTELLMRSKSARKLNIKGDGLGRCFHPNQDSVNIVFDCDDPQELDRGPTITTSLLYDRLPTEQDADARWRLRFSGANREPKVGDAIVCDLDGKSSYAAVASPAYLLSGSYAGESNAVGEVVIRGLTRSERDQLGLEETVSGPESFRVDGALSIYIPANKNGERNPPAGGFNEQAKNERARREGQPEGRPTWVTNSVQRLRQWLLIQDGGMSAELASTIGPFRSPLWLRRNGFVEAPGPFTEDQQRRRNRKHAAISQKPGFAEFPVQALTDVVSSLTRGGGSQLNAVTDYGLQLLLEPAPKNGGDADPDGRDYHVIPKQLRKSLTELRSRILDDVGLGAEEIVAAFLDKAAETMAPQIEEALATLNSGALKRVTDDNPSLPEDVVKLALRLGVQLLWGSQGGLARSVAEYAASTALPSQDNLVQLVLGAAKWILDYRLANGHNTAVLTMGLDSMPGTLHLDLPWELELGDILRGETSGQTALVISKRLEFDIPEGNTPPSSEDADKSQVFAIVSGGFAPGELVSSPSKVVGTFLGAEPQPKVAPTDVEILKIVLKGAVGGESPSAVIQNAPLRATLPAVVDTPERGIAERILRDMASGWGGELRTDPQWTFFRKRVTVHPQGGCPMRNDKRGHLPEAFGVTDLRGEVRGCPGIYVMDAAAFPGPVGANPSATIAALAEYKVELFLRDQLTNRPGIQATLDDLEKARAEATKWINSNGLRSRLDPLGPKGVVPPTGCSGIPYHRPVGVKFKERMTGTARPESSQGTHGEEIEIFTDLTVCIDDLASFLVHHERDSRVQIPIADGRLDVCKQTKEEKRKNRHNGGATKKEDEPLPNIDTERSFMRVMVDPATRDDRGEVRTIEYHLVTKDCQYRLEGRKVIRDDPGPDLLDDTTTLSFDLFEQSTANGKTTYKNYRGTLTLYVEELFGRQIPGFEVLTDDPARQAWAMASFLRFFAGNLVDIYLPSLRPLTELAAGLTRRAHG